MQKIVSGITLECIQGDIAHQQDIDAVVNAANAQLRTGGGVAGALHRAAGPELEKECRRFAPINPGQAVITSGHNLPNVYVIHCLGPVYGVDKPEDKLLGSCYAKALKLAEDHRLSSIAFPAISTGIFGYPTQKAAKVAFETVIAIVPNLIHLKLIRFVLFSQKDLEIHTQVLASLL